MLLVQDNRINAKIDVQTLGMSDINEAKEVGLEGEGRGGVEDPFFVFHECYKNGAVLDKSRNFISHAMGNGSFGSSKF